jgi:hypothetical protein
MRKGVVVIALTVLPLVPLSPAAASDEPVLFGMVGPGFTIDLKDAKGPGPRRGHSSARRAGRSGSSRAPTASGPTGA